MYVLAILDVLGFTLLTLLNNMYSIGTLFGTYRTEMPSHRYRMYMNFQTDVVIFLHAECPV